MTSTLTQEAVALLGRLIATPRISRDETAAADLFGQFLTANHISYQREANNIWCTAPGYDAARPTLLLNAHIDTVRPVSGWQRDPFTPTTEDSRLYGLGANDDGASLVSLLQAFRQLSAKPQRYNLVFLASAEEEVSGANGVGRVLPLLPPVSVALVGEPTGMQPAVAEKGLMVLDITAHGKAGHAARNEGINAIYRAIQAVERLHNFTFEEVSPLLGPVKMTTTIIQAGTQHNVVPDTCTFTVDVRSNECYGNETIYYMVCRELAQLCDDPKTFDVKARSFHLNSSRIDRRHPLVVQAEEMGRIPFGSPTLSDQSQMPFPSMKMGPGQSSRSHTADEFIEIAEIEEAIGIYIRLLDGLDINAQSMTRD